MQDENTDAEVDFHVKMRRVMQEQEGAVAANEVMMKYFCQGGIEPIYPGYFSGRYIKDNTTKSWYCTPYCYIRAAGFTAYASHQGVAWTYANAYNHSGYCIICRATVYDPHTPFIDSRGICSRCGRECTPIAP